VEEAIVEEAPVYEAPAFEEEAPAAPVADNGKNPATLWMILNIVITVLTCCGCGLNILGIIGIVFGVMGMNAYKSGDVATGDSKTKVAKIMFFVALAMGILSVIISMSTYGLSLFVALMEEFS